MSNRETMPWDNLVKDDYSGKDTEAVQGSKTIGTDDNYKYGQGKPIRITIVGDITSDKNQV